MKLSLENIFCNKSHGSNKNEFFGFSRMNIILVGEQLSFRSLLSLE
jgi:hypothetical protein